MPRWCDALLAALLLAVLSPLLLAVAVLVRATSKGPVLFRQVRVGRHGVPFSLLKFRTMTAGGEAGSPLTVGRDARITRVGHALRRYRLDELPQLVNVLAGDMALVGARPELPGFLTPAMATALLQRRPGLTDPASLTYLDEADLLSVQPDPERYYREVLLPRKVQASTEYARRRTAWSDVGMLLRTAACLVHRGPGPQPDEIRP